jgi:hypothetical protein
LLLLVFELSAGFCFFLLFPALPPWIEFSAAGYDFRLIVPIPSCA